MEWKTLKLKEVICKPISGEWGKEILNKEGENPVRILRTANFTNKGIINYEDVVLRNVTSEKVEQKRLLHGDILVEKSGGTDKYPVGRVVFYDRKDEVYLSNNFTTVFRAKKDVVCNRFLFYYLMFNYNRGGIIKYYNQTTGIQNLRLNNLVKELEIPVPPIKIQKQIVEVLDESQKLMDNRKKQIEVLDDLIESIFYDMFGDPAKNHNGWEVERLGDVTKFIDYRGKTPQTQENGILLITAKNIGKKEFRKEPVEYISTELYKERMTRGFPKANDVMFVTEGATMGFVCRVPRNTEKFSVGQRVITLVCKDKLREEYLHYFIYDRIFQGEVSRRSTGSSAKGIRASELKKVEIQVPTIQLQDQFAEKVQAIEEQKSLLEQSLKLMEDNYNSLMQGAFKGELF